MWIFGVVLILLALPLYISQWLKGDQANPRQVRLATLMFIVAVVIIMLDAIGIFPGR